jgi:thiol:disulfide interchange protein DsbD
MDALRKALAFPMFAAAAWLTWVLTLQAGTTALAALLIAGVIAALAAWLFGAGQRAGRSPPLFGGAALAFAAAVAVAAAGLSAPADAARPGAAASAVPSEPFSPARLEALRAERRPVFVDFTAAWCVTCQVNERVALSSRKVAAAFARADAVYLKADWTRRDPVIAETLKRHGREGVPLYLLYGRDGGEAKVLPQLLTEGLVVEALAAASA